MVWISSRIIQGMWLYIRAVFQLTYKPQVDDDPHLFAACEFQAKERF